MTERQDKKSQFEQGGGKSSKKWVVIAAVAAMVVAAFAWIGLAADGGNVVSASGGQVTIPLAEVGDGQAHFYTYRDGGTDVKFFLLKSRDGVVRAALDSCDVCYREKKGYRQEGDQMVCNNCNQKFPSNRINDIKGGCNPAPLNRRVAGGQVVIAEAELRQGTRYFRGE